MAPFKYLIIGPPGTGKTSTAIKILEHLIGQKNHEDYLAKLGINIPYAKYNLRDVAFVSFQTSVIREFAERTGLTLDYHEGSETEFFGTFHAIAYRMARDHGLIKNNNKQYSPEEQFKYFLDQNGLRNQFDLSHFGMANPSLKGNRVWMALTKAVGVYWPRIGQGAYSMARLMLDDPELAKYIPMWLKWKEGQNPWGVEIIDYNDMLITAYEGLKEGKIKPLFKVLIVDEAQDLNPLMWAIIDLLKPYLEGIIILGDPDQAIFGFSGANPRLLEEWDDREPGVVRVVLPQSYRLPRKIKIIAIRIIERTKNRKQKEFKARDLEGVYHHGFLDLRDPRDVENFLKIIKTEAEKLAKEKEDDKIDILILARTNALALKLARLLLRYQVKFEHLKSENHSIWEMGFKEFGTLGDLIEVLKKVKSGERLSFGDYITLLGYSKIARRESDLESYIETLRSGNFPLDLMELKRNPFSVLDRVRILMAMYPGLKEREVSRWINTTPAMAREFFELIEDIVTGRDKPLEIPEGIRIAIDTLHASKGREGKVVIIWNNLTNSKWYSHYLRSREDFDNELRAWYVGVTRALEKLYILDGPYPFLESV